MLVMRKIDNLYNLIILQYNNSLLSSENHLVDIFPWSGPSENWIQRLQEKQLSAQLLDLATNPEKTQLKPAFKNIPNWRGGSYYSQGKDSSIHQEMVCSRIATRRQYVSENTLHEIFCSSSVKIEEETT